MSFFVHPQGLCESAAIGAGTRIWAFAHVLPRARIGIDCNICDGVFIENDVVLGDRVTVKCGVQLWDGCRVEDDVFIGPNAAFSNDPFPRSKFHDKPIIGIHIERGASIGANCTVLPGIRIGRHAMVGAGSVVTRDVPAFAVVAGNPARITGYVNARKVREEAPLEQAPTAGKAPAHSVTIPGVALHELASYEDLRGRLSVGGLPGEVPFTPKRFYFVHQVPSKHVRGEHALRTCRQFMICVAGSVRIVLDDGTLREEALLNRPDLGLYVPPMIWVSQYGYTEEAVLLVFASHPYDPADYIRDYDAYLRLRMDEA